MLHMKKLCSEVNPLPKIETMDTDLCKLVMEGDCEGVKKLFVNNIEILRGVTPRGNSCLHVAAARGHHEMVNLLVRQRPCMLSTPNLNQEMPLHTAARSGNSRVVEALLNVDNGLQCNCSSHLCTHRIKVQEIWKAQNDEGETALHYAVKGNHLGIVEQLLTKVKGIELIVNKLGESALYTACYYGCFHIGKKLLSLGPAVGDKRISCLEMGGKRLLPVGLAVGDSRIDGTSCLHQAIINILEWSRRGEGVQEMLSQVIDRGQWHDFALQLAFLLVRERPQLAETVDAKGNSPLHLLVALPVPDESHLDLVKDLLNAGPKMNFLLNKDDMAPIHIAARDGNGEVIRCLLDSAPHCSYSLGKGNKNALHFALERKVPRPSLVSKLDCLLQNSVDIGFLLNEPDNEGKTALSKADEALFQSLKHLIGKGMWGTPPPSPNIFQKSNASKSSHLDFIEVEAKGNHSKEDVDVKKMNERFSVTATLIASITFAAAFTMPGGFDEDNGSPVLLHKPALKTFLLCASVAFSFSLLSLFELLSTPLKAYFLAWYVLRNEDAGIRKNIEEQLALRAIKYLKLSLHATRVAFVTGIYVVVAPKCQWLAITICIITFTIPLVDLIWSCSMAWLSRKDLEKVWDVKWIRDASLYAAR